MGANRRVALKQHKARIREWTEEGRTDAWMAEALGTSASSVQSFRSRNGIPRRANARQEPEVVFEAVLDGGEEGLGLRPDPSILEDPIWKGHWAGVESVTVKLADDSIIVEPDPPDGPSEDAPAGAEAGAPRNGGPEPPQRGRVKWFDPEKGYGFLVRPTGEDLFVHRSGVELDPAALAPGRGVEYGLGRNDRGPVALRVRHV